MGDGTEAEDRAGWLHQLQRIDGQKLQVLKEALEEYKGKVEMELVEHNHVIEHHPDQPPSLQLCIQERDGLKEKLTSLEALEQDFHHGDIKTLYWDL